MKQIKIEQLLPLLKSGWVAMDENGNWWWYSHRPVSGFLDNCWHQLKGNAEQLYMFKLKKFKGDWKDSLIKVEHSKKKSTDRKDFDDFVEQHGVSPYGFLTEAILKEDFECWKKRRKNERFY